MRFGIRSALLGHRREINSVLLRASVKHQLNSAICCRRLHVTQCMFGGKNKHRQMFISRKGIDFQYFNILPASLFYLQIEFLRVTQSNSNSTLTQLNKTKRSSISFISKFTKIVITRRFLNSFFTEISFNLYFIYFGVSSTSETEARVLILIF